MQPATVSLSSGGQVPIVLTVDTATNSATPFGRAPDARRFDRRSPASAGWTRHALAQWILSLFLLLVVWAMAAKRELTRGWRLAQTGAVAILLSIGLAACFGGGTGGVVPAGTPTGTYAMTVTGTFTGTAGSTTRTVQVTLIVQ